MGVPRRRGERERKLGGEMLGDRKAVHAESGKSADGTADLEDKGAFGQREQTLAVAEEGVEPASGDRAERSGERLLEEGAGDDGSGAVLVGDGGQGIAERIEVGENHRGCGTELEDERGVDGVLAGGAPVDEAGGAGVLPGDELGELFDERDCKISGGGNGGGECGKVEKLGATICGDDGRGGGGDDASFGFGAGVGGFEIE